MNDKLLEENINLVVKKLLETAETLGEAGTREIPLFFEELLALPVAWLAFSLSLAITLSIVAYALSTKIENEGAYRPGASALCVVCLVLSFFSWVATGINATEAIKATVAPRVYILDYLQGSL